MIKVQRIHNDNAVDITTYTATSNTILELAELRGSDFVYWQTDKTESHWGTIRLRERISLAKGQVVYLKIYSGVGYLAEMKDLT